MDRRRIYLATLILAASLCQAAPLPLWGNLPAPSHIEHSGRLDSLFAELNLAPDYVIVLGADSTAFQAGSAAFPLLRLVQDSSGWQSRGPLLSPVCNIKNIHSLILNLPTSRYHLLIETADGFSTRITPYAALFAECDVLGISSRNGHSVMKCRRRRQFLPQMKEADYLITTNHGAAIVPREKIAHAFTRQSYYFAMDDDTLFAIQEIPQR